MTISARIVYYTRISVSIHVPHLNILNDIPIQILVGK
jgi:hypothetical protein